MRRRVSGGMKEVCVRVHVKAAECVLRASTVRRACDRVEGVYGPPVASVLP